MRKWASAAVALAFVGLACGGSGSGGDAGKEGGGAGSGGTGGTSGHPNDGGKDAKDTGGGGPTIASACMTFAMTQCANLESCSKVLIKENYLNLTACVAAQNTLCVNELSAPSTGSTPADKVACAAAINSQSCADFIAEQNIPAACVIKPGTVASGGACAFNAQCSTSFCQGMAKSECGTCAAAPAEGAACMGSCGQGLVCDAMSKTCVKVGEAGATCSATAPCAVEAGLWCVGADPKTGTTGTCMAGVATVGAACDFGLTKGPACDASKGLTCDATSKVCVAVMFAGPAKPCGLIAGVRGECIDNATCQATPTVPLPPGRFSRV